MMKKNLLPFLSAGLLLGAVPFALHGQSIIQTGGVSDWTLQYDEVADQFHVVFRASTSTVWNSDDGQVLANNGLFGAVAANDYTFDTLTIRLHGYETINANGIDYFVSSRGGSSAEPDLGIRTRFEHAFSDFTLTLDVANSTLPGEVAIFQLDELGLNPSFQLNTANNLFSSNWEPQGHSHWHWGFSEAGNYSLVFNMSGSLLEGGMSSLGVTTVNFEVIPEPATVGVLLGLGVLGAVVVLRRRRSHT